ncbi:MAG: hypothetical protein FJ397_10960 [Verrucomicrobia bacterium]|nr:hypothetical protein [Verrucomicrobiota bacterium]
MREQALVAFYVPAVILLLWAGLAAVACRFAPHGFSPRRRLLLGLVAAALAFLPAGGVPLWVRAFSFHPNPCLPLLGLGVVAWGRVVLERSWFGREDWLALWGFGAVAGTVLYGHPLVATDVDVYFWGWERGVAASVLGALAVLAIAGGLRAGLLLVAALAALGLDALESRNAWDYVIDPFYWLLSLGMLAAIWLRAARRARRAGPAATVNP